MEGYIGEYEIDIKETPFANYGPTEWALYFIERYGGINGEHHKQWVLDQTARILNGTPIIVAEARWLGGQRELRVHTDRPASKHYLSWIAEMQNGEDGPNTHTWSNGWAP